MRRLTQKELANEGIGSFLKNVGKGAAIVGGKALKGLAKAASPTAAGLASKAKGAISDTAKAVKTAITTPEERIIDYFKDMSYNVEGIFPGETKDTRVVKVSEVIYDDEGKGTTNTISSPYVVKIDKSGIKVLRGPRRVPKGDSQKDNKNKGKTSDSSTSIQESQKKLLKHLNSGSRMNKWVIGR